MTRPRDQSSLTLFLGKLKWIVVVIMQLALISSARGGDMVNHSFSFDARVDSPDAEVLDYQYGSSGQFGTHANKEMVQRGRVFGQWNTYGAMPRGEFLYVKWRLKSSGQIYEDKVDLTTRLPADITDSGIHFVIKESQLYVYLLPPPGTRPIGGPKEATYLKQHQIYPDQAK